MVFQKTLELWIKILIVFDAVDVVVLHHPFDMQSSRAAEFVVRQYRFCNFLGWPNNRALRAEAIGELRAESA